ncbi:hypothetical protein BH11CYA1_BH11CYA1_22990 [soil metagenome]
MIFKQSTKANQLTKFFSLTLALGLICLASSPAIAGNVLQGGVLQEDQYKNNNQGLNRKDIQGDPFSESASSNGNPVDEMLQLPPGNMDMAALRPPAPPKKPMSGSAQDSGNDFNGKNMAPIPEEMPQQQQQPPQRLNGNTQNNRNDPDSGSAEMQLLWDAWHKRVAEAIFTRFNSLAQMAFKHSPPLACQVSYMVARDGRVGNVQVLQKSSNPIFNTMLLGVINSMNNNPVLEYPPNSRRQFVEKTGTFTWNYGQQGFKYTTGDQERIQQQRGQGQNNNMQNNNMQPMQNQMRQPNQMMQQNNGNQQMNNGMQQMRQQMQQPMQMMQQMFR